MTIEQQGFKVFLETFGCQMNILDSELIAGQMKKAGHTFVDNSDEANVVLLNTCSVRELCEQKVRSRLGILRNRKQRGEKVVVGVLGCMAERAQEELKKQGTTIDVLVGPSKIHDTLSLIEKAYYEEESPGLKKSLSNFVMRKGKAEEPSMSPLDSLEALDRTRSYNQTLAKQAYVRITRGCNKFCSFCVVPRTRGPEVHRPPLSIIDEVKTLVAGGAKEITLLGQTINHYFYESESEKWSFADLLREVHDQNPNLLRLRFLTSYPRDFTDEALDVMAKSERICKYLHIPAQSGSDKVLREMNRGYDVATYLSLIERAKSRMPDISLIGDMIVGFPNETDDDFEQSLELLRTVRFKNVFIFKYSPRPNTIAIKNLVDNVPVSVKKARNNKMLSVQNEIALSIHQNMIGKTFNVLCEGPTKLSEEHPRRGLIELRPKGHIQLLGRTEGDHIVHFFGPEKLIGELLTVKIDEARPLSLSGVLV